MAIVRRQKDPRSVEQRRADERLLARFEGGQALPVTRKAVEEAARRVRRRNADRRQEVARLGIEIAELRRSFGLTQAEIARTIGTSKPNICALERGRARAESPGAAMSAWFVRVADPSAKAFGWNRASHGDAAALHVLRRQAAGLRSAPLAEDGTSYTTLCLFLASGCRALNLRLETRHWVAARATARAI